MPLGSFYYVSLPFDVKNVGATYHQCIQVCLQIQVRCNAKDYIDDIAVKSKKADQLIVNLEKIFVNL